MSIFDLQESNERARERFGRGRKAAARPTKRADAGRFRLDPAVQEKLVALLSGQEKPAFVRLYDALQSYGARARRRCPTRATVYAFMARGPGHSYVVADLPEPVRSCLYNLEGTVEVPGHQLAFHAFQHGTSRALSFAAGLPWLDLYQAARMRGWRPRSRGLLEAVLRIRRI
jgi:hypothetical protein